MASPRPSGPPVKRSGGTTAALAASSAAEAAARGLPPLTVRAERLAASISLGVHGRGKAGLGQDFWQFHRYHDGDDAAGIDWRQSARSQHLFVREREAEAAQTVLIWREGAPTMRFSSHNESKIDRASLIGLALGLLLVRAGERVGLYGGAKPGASRASYFAMAEALAAPPADDATPPTAPLPRHAQFVWVGDFLSPLDEIEAAMRRLIQHGAHGRLVHIIDPAEEDFPYSGRTKFEAADGSESRLLGRAESLRTAYRQRFAARSEALGTLARSLGWSYLAHRTDRSAKTALVALFADLSGQLDAVAGGRR